MLLLFLLATAPQLLTELNQLRADPHSYAAKLEARRRYYKGSLLELPNQVPLQTNEGVRALSEAIRALKTPAPVVAPSAALAKAAADHVRDIGTKGLTSHEGSDGSTSTSRIHKHVPDAHHFAEVISFGPDSPSEVIIGLLVDDGVPSRGHRKILLDPVYRIAGAACGPHKTYGTVCVIDFAD